MIKNKPIVIPEELWQHTWSGLRTRGEGAREAACVWAGSCSEREELVSEVVFLDDFPGVKSFALQHQTSRTATDALFEGLRVKRLSIIADVHTHPEDWVDLSWVDKAHPIEYRPGLSALVLPYYATSIPAIATTGIHIYLGDGRWKRLHGRRAQQKVQIR